MGTRSPSVSVGRSRRPLIEYRLTRLIVGWAAVVALMLAWQIIGNDQTFYFLPSFTTVLSHVGTLLHGSPLTHDTLPSLGRAAGGYVLGCGLGMIVGILIGYFRKLDAWVRPVLEFFRALPAPVAVTLGLILLGFSTMTRIYAIAFGCFFVVVLNATDGARRIDRQLIDTARVAGLSRAKILLRVVLPGSLPQAAAGLRLAVSLALIGMVISELLGSSSGLGFFISNAENNFNYADVWATVVVLGIIGWLGTALFALAERRVLSWHHDRQEVERRG
jgi:ABC-type nitrate/sulfonate/bicarbonate transport system permease component